MGPVTGTHYIPFEQLIGEPGVQQGREGASYPNHQQLGHRHHRSFDGSHNYSDHMSHSRQKIPTEQFPDYPTNSAPYYPEREYQDMSPTGNRKHNRRTRDMYAHSFSTVQTTQPSCSFPENALRSQTHPQSSPLPVNNAQINSRLSSPRTRPSQYATTPTIDLREIATIQFNSTQAPTEAYEKLQNDRQNAVGGQHFNISGSADETSNIIVISAPAGKNLRGFVKNSCGNVKVSITMG
jgi:hypothetical protein